MHRYLVLDFDSTFVQVEGLDELARIVLEDDPERDGKTAEIERLTKSGMDGDIGFGESLAGRLALFCPQPQHIERVIDLLRHRITPSVLQHKKFIRDHADRIFIISGGFREYIVPVVEEFGIRPDHVLANEFIHDKSGKVIGCDLHNPLAHDGGKVQALDELNLNGPVVMVGDGYSDLHTRLEGAVDYFAAFIENVARPTVKRQADAVAENFDDVLQCLDSRQA
jgi:D-3-phosphoglycerate dehydrogenase